MKRLPILLFTFLVAALIWAMPGAAHAQAKKLNVIASTTIIEDIAQNVAGTITTVDFLVPTDGDVHAFEPKPEDVKKIANADLILVNGVGLEQFIDKLIADSGTKGKVVGVTGGLGIQRFLWIEARRSATGPGTQAAAGGLPVGIIGISGSYKCGAPAEGEDIGECDPHMWQNVANVIAYTLNIRDALTAADPANDDTYNTNAGIYISELQKLDTDLFLGLANNPEG